MPALSSYLPVSHGSHQAIPLPTIVRLARISGFKLAFRSGVRRDSRDGSWVYTIGLLLQTIFSAFTMLLVQQVPSPLLALLGRSCCMNKNETTSTLCFQLKCGISVLIVPHVLSFLGKQLEYARRRPSKWPKCSNTSNKHAFITLPLSRSFGLTITTIQSKFASLRCALASRNF